MKINYDDLNYYRLQQYIEENGIGDDDACFCRSGLSFSACCKLNQEAGILESLRLQELISHKLKASSRQTQDECLISTCKEKAIMSHAIQKNGYLDQLSKNEHLYVFTKAFNQGKYYVRDSKLSMNIATTFNGFCNYHDTKVFLDIEVYKGEEFIINRLIAHSYRSIAYKYRCILNELDLIEGEHFSNFPLLYHNEIYDPDYIVYQAYLISHYHTLRQHQIYFKETLYELEKCFDMTNATWMSHDQLTFSDVLKVKGTRNPLVFFCSEVVNTNGLFMEKNPEKKAFEIITLMVLPDQNGDYNSVFLSSYGKHSELIDYFNHASDQVRLNMINNIILSHLNELFLSEKQMTVIRSSENYYVIEERLLDEIRIDINNFDLEVLSKEALINFFE
ncbi:hypothetical protein EZV73_22145 [Acidaminobacter sp. JC074]|uniref:hypothetical protein n=1 Tax=Acidaminobacter sp. JC074 TaxID=2530199 RepID=UPI001F0FC8D5|nr:hypothetical protein [Acidaminobacter sp. JC074]MCH4890300.1 hypothetical protein [Acidaminobacter sp. JC074]